MKRNNEITRLIGAFGLAVVTSTAAFAQTAQQAAESADRDDAAVLDEIIVTGDAFSESDGLRARQSSTESQLRNLAQWRAGR